jgi:hypothetical protein
LYEDTDFTLRVAKTGKLYLNTTANYIIFMMPVRSNQYQYGKRMVVRNGWYVANKIQPSRKHKLKWHAITILLTVIRFTDVITSSSKRSTYRSLGLGHSWMVGC